MIRLAILDDDKRMCNIIHNCMTAQLFSKNVDYQIDEYEDGFVFLASKKVYDCLFLDIEMPKMNGFEVAKQCYETKENLLIIYITSHDERMRESFGLNIFGFIRKDKMEADMKELCNRLLSFINEIRFLEFDTCYGKQMIRYDEIICFELSHRKITISTIYDQILLKTDSLRKIEQKLNEDFIRPNNHFLINMRYVQKIEKNVIYLSNKRTTHISHGQIRQITKQVQDYKIKRFHYAR